jgi:hypothetical protein
MNVKSFCVVFAGVLVGCSAIRPGMGSAKPVDPSIEKAKAIYAEIADKMSQPKTITFSYHLVINDQEQGNFLDGTYAFQKPDLSRTTTSDNIMITDGEKDTNIFLSLNQYRQRSIIHETDERNFEFFGFEPAVLGKAIPITSVPQMSTLDGKPVVLVHMKDGSNRVDVYYSVETRLPVKCVITEPGFLIWGGEKKAYTYSNVALNPPISKSTFEVDYKRFTPMDVYEGQIDSSKIGTQCPDFEITTLDSNVIRLATELKTHQAMLLTIWAHG